MNTKPDYEKYKRGFFTWFFKDTLNWIPVLAVFIMCLIVLFGSRDYWNHGGTQFGIAFFFVILLVLIVGNVIHWRQNKEGKSS